jgi:hypothetical protein
MKLKVNNNENLIINENRKIISLTPIDDNTTQIELLCSNSIYEIDYIRITSFILAKERYDLSKIIEKNIDTIVYIHTNGIISIK